MKKLLALSLSLTLLTACASAPADSIAATPEPTAAPVQTAEPAPEPTLAPSPTPAPTMTVYDPVSLDDWKSTTAYPMPEYSFSAPHKPQMEQKEKVQLPESGTVQLRAGWNRSLEEAAETYGIPAEQLQAMNPDATWDRYEYILLQEEPYTLPNHNVVTVTVTEPQWESFRTMQFDVPASLDRQAQATLATAYFFQCHYYGASTGFSPLEEIDNPQGDYYYRAVAGAAFAKYSDLESFLHTVYSDSYASKIAGGPDAPYIEGENDSILFYMAARGSNILYCGTLFTEPELQPDGSLKFWQLSLQLDQENFGGWGEEGPFVPVDAFASPVQLVPTETGWRVDKLELPN